MHRTTLVGAEDVGRLQLPVFGEYGRADSVPSLQPGVLGLQQERGRGSQWAGIALLSRLA